MWVRSQTGHANKSLKRLGVRCLKGTESHAIVILNVNQANAQQFEASLGTSGSSRPELSEPRSLVSRLGDKARVHRYGSELSRTHLVRKEEVEREPVKVIPGEGPARNISLATFSRQSERAFYNL